MKSTCNQIFQDVHKSLVPSLQYHTSTSHSLNPTTGQHQVTINTGESQAQLGLESTSQIDIAAINHCYVTQLRNITHKTTVNL